MKKILSLARVFEREIKTVETGSPDAQTIFARCGKNRWVMSIRCVTDGIVEYDRKRTTGEVLRHLFSSIEIYEKMPEIRKGHVSIIDMSGY